MCENEVFSFKNGAMGPNIVDLTRACCAHMGEKYKHTGQEQVSTIRAVFEDFQSRKSTPDAYI